jgi:hypothetical protein
MHPVHRPDLIGAWRGRTVVANHCRNALLRRFVAHREALRLVEAVDTLGVTTRPSRRSRGPPRRACPPRPTGARRRRDGL